jgi:type II secretory pathway component PulF
VVDLVMTAPCLVTLLVILMVVVRVFRARRRIETRSRLLELLSRATRRGLSLVPLLERASREERGHRGGLVRDLAARIDAGESLGEAMRHAGRRLAPFHVSAAISAAEGSARLPETLGSLAESDHLELGRRHRLGLIFLYPALILLVLASNRGLGVLQEVSAALEVPGPSMDARMWCLAISVAIAAGILLTVILRWVGCMPGGRLLASGRLLRGLSTLLAAGVPLGDAMRRAGGASGSALMSWRARRAAAALDAGGSASEMWRRTGLSRVATTRLAAEDGRHLAATLVETARICDRRHEDRAERSLHLIYPTVLLVAGALVAVEFAGIFRLLGHAQRSLW